MAETSGTDVLTGPDEQSFVRDTEQFRRELLAHCYRMTGSVEEAEDLVQETYLRAWRSYDTFEGRASLRVWLYRIATNVCLTALRNRGRRPLPSGLGGPGEEPEAPLVRAGADVVWLQPVPDALVRADTGDPAVIVAARESIRLALVAALQFLTPRQRAALILQEVLAWSAAEVAEVLETSTPAVKSMLQRARARLGELAPETKEKISEPSEPEARALLDRYMSAFENSDAALLEKVLVKDATLEMTPALTWFSGIATCLRYLDAQVLGSPGDWLLLPTRANGQPAAAAYYRGADGGYEALGISVLTVSPAGITRICVFGDPSLMPVFGFEKAYQSAAQARASVPASA